jgi:hypothetical protein
MATHEWSPLMPCPFCGVRNECASNVGGRERAPPEPGAVIICYSCGHVSIIGDDGRLHEPTATEREELARDPGVQRALKAQREVKRRIAKYMN